MKQLVLRHEGNEYTLQYTRSSIVRLEKEGFVIKNAEDSPMTILPKLFLGAFYANHPKMDAKLADEIFAKISKKTALFEALTEMFSEPLQALFDEPNEEDAKNVEWETNW